MRLISLIVTLTKLCMCHHSGPSKRIFSSHNMYFNQKTGESGGPVVERQTKNRQILGS